MNFEPEVKEEDIGFGASDSLNLSNCNAKLVKLLSDKTTQNNFENSNSQW